MRPLERWVTQYYQITLSLYKFGLSEYAEKTRFGVFNLNNSEIFRFPFLFFGEKHYRHLYEKINPTLGSSGVVHGKVCWLIAYKCDQCHQYMLTGPNPVYTACCDGCLNTVVSICSLS